MLYGDRGMCNDRESASSQLRHRAPLRISSTCPVRHDCQSPLLERLATLSFVYHFSLFATRRWWLILVLFFFIFIQAQLTASRLRKRRAVFYRIWILGDSGLEVFL